jgi:putative PEP-CTERM system histidine kinase
MSAVATLVFISALASGVMAFMVVWHDRRSVAHRSFVAGMAVLSLESIFNGLSLDTTSTDEIIYWQEWALAAMSFLPGIWIFFSLSYGRGNYREFLKKWREVLVLAFVIPVGLVVLFHENLIAPVIKTNELPLKLQLPGIVLYILFLLGALFMLMNLERTFRASVGTMRWRIKFMILGLGVLFAVRSYTSSQALLYQSLDLKLQIVNSGALLIGCGLIVRSLLRAGHFDMDVYPSRSVLQNSFTVLLAGIYLLVIGVFAKVVTFLGGDAAFPLKAFVVLVALVLLTILLLSERVRLHTSRFISRHFQRPLYDYRTVWKKFTENTVSCMQQTELCQASVKSVTDLFHVLSVTIWLVDDKKEQLEFSTSTFLSETKARELKPNVADTIEVINALQNHPEPVDIDASSEPWAATLRACHPDEFRKGGNRICVPLVVGGEVLGLMILGDHVGSAIFSWQDFDLLKCVADQVAAGLRNVQLSQKLLQAKELEAFQTMSAFFVHDLKNTASTLNLMLKNLPVHFDDPAFRADALRGVSKSVAHINQLIERLSLLRHELQIRPIESDFNEVVAKSLAGWENVPGVNLVKELRPLPKILLDQEQMLKVVINLVLNAKEAASQLDGQVRIETSRNNGWALLTVSDNGCGMSPEFLNRSLFRPFKTTKKNGLGIGMFQSKMIIDAHKGRIEVESAPGKGTVFRLYLPIQKAN